MTKDAIKMPRRQSEEMFPIIKRYFECDLTQTNFCDQEDLALPTFHYWLKKYKQQMSAKSEDTPCRQAFLPLRLTSQSHAEATCEIALPNGILIRFGYPLKPEQLVQYITVLGV